MYPIEFAYFFILFCAYGGIQYHLTQISTRRFAFTQQGYQTMIPQKGSVCCLCSQCSIHKHMECSGFMSIICQSVLCRVCQHFLAGSGWKDSGCLLQASPKEHFIFLSLKNFPLVSILSLVSYPILPYISKIPSFCFLLKQNLMLCFRFMETEEFGNLASVSNPTSWAPPPKIIYLTICGKTLTCF